MLRRQHTSYAVAIPIILLFVNVGSLYTDCEGGCDERVIRVFRLLLGIYDHNDR